MKRLLLFFLLTAWCLLPAVVQGQDTPGTIKFPAAVDSADSLFRVADGPRSQTIESMTSSSLSVNVTTTSVFPVTGSFKIDDEVIYYTGKTSSSFTGLVRGSADTAAAGHVSGAKIFAPVLAVHHNALSQAIVEIEKKVGPGDSPASTAATGAVPTKQGDGSTQWVLPTVPVPLSYLDTDGTLAGNSDVKIASQKAVKTYADSGLAAKVPTTRTVNGHALSANVTVTPGDLSLVIGTDVEAYDADLLAIAALSPANDDVIQRKVGAWINRTMAQVKTDLVLVKGDVALGNVVNLDTSTTANITDSTNKRFVTDAQRTVLGNTSGTNTGDQDLSGLVPTTRTVNGHPLSANVTVTPGDLSLVIGTNVEAYSADLLAIAGLAPSNDDLLQRKAGAWINRTPAQVKTDLVLVKGDVGLGNVVNLDTSTTANITDSTNKRFVTDAQRTVLGNTSGTNTGDQDLSGLVPTTRTVNGHPLSANVTVTPGDLSLVIGTNVEAYSADLLAIAGLTPTNNDVIQRKAGVWTNRTPAQVKTDLALTKSDVGLGNVANLDTSTTANITDSADKRFVTDAQRTVIGNTSGANTGDQTVFGRVGNIVAATNDYTWAQLNKATSSLADITTRSAADLSSGSLSDARLSSNVPLLNANDAFTGNDSFGGAFTLSGALSPTALSGDVNDYNPTGMANALALRLDGGASDRNITGLSGGSDGRIVTITNIGGTNNLVLKNQSSSSTAANRFLVPGNDVTLAPDTALALRYDGTSSRWRPWSRALANSGVSAGSYGSASQVGTFTVDAQGRLTAAANLAIVVPYSSVSSKDVVDADVDAAAAIAWSKISKSGSSLADLATRSAGDLNSGTLLAARLPSPTATTLGGIQSLAPAAHKWINAISTSGVPSATQPDASDLTGLGTAATQNTGTSGAMIPLLNSNNTTSGSWTFGKAVIMPNNSLTDNGTTIATDASLGNNFRVSALTANVTLSNPTNPTDGQVVAWEVIQNASAAKTLSFGTNFAFGSEITACTISTALSSHSFVTAIYNSTATKWYVRGCITGY